MKLLLGWCFVISGWIWQGAGSALLHPSEIQPQIQEMLGHLHALSTPEEWQRAWQKQQMWNVLIQEAIEQGHFFDLSEKTWSAFQHHHLLFSGNLFNAIQKLNLAHTDFQGEWLICLPPSLEELNLQNNPIGQALGDPKKCPLIGAAFLKLKNLRSLDLSYHRITEDDLFPDFNQQLTAAQIEILAPFVSSCLFLEKLDLSGHGFEMLGALLLVEGIANCEQLRVLNLHGNRIQFSLENFHAFGKKLISFQHLEELHWGGNQLGEWGALELMRWVPHLKALRIFDCSGNGLGWPGIECLQRGLQQEMQAHCPHSSQSIRHLKVLDLRWNYIEVRGVKSVLALKVFFPELQILY